MYKTSNDSIAGNGRCYGKTGFMTENHYPNQGVTGKMVGKTQSKQKSIRFFFLKCTDRDWSNYAYRKDTEHLYHAFVYSLVLLLLQYINQL